MSQELVLIRGLPGSGKSTLAKEMHGYMHFEADMFFSKNGEYVFDSSKIKEAHEWCQWWAKDNLSRGYKVVVANTFTRKWEMQPYIDMAAEFNIPVRVLVATGNFQNIHGVPEEAISRMRDRWEE